MFARFQRTGDYHRMLAVAVQLKREKHRLANQLIELAAQQALIKNDMDFAWKAALYAGFEPPI